jgi:hypothetical protein
MALCSLVPDRGAAGGKLAEGKFFMGELPHARSALEKAHRHFFYSP